MSFLLLLAFVESESGKYIEERDQCYNFGDEEGCLNLKDRNCCWLEIKERVSHFLLCLDFDEEFSGYIDSWKSKANFSLSDESNDKCVELKMTLKTLQTYGYDVDFVSATSDPDAIVCYCHGKFLMIGTCLFWAFLLIFLD